jgi:hypothetical protein
MRLNRIDVQAAAPAPRILHNQGLLRHALE